MDQDLDKKVSTPTLTKKSAIKWDLKAPEREVLFFVWRVPMPDHPEYLGWSRTHTKPSGTMSFRVNFA